MNTAALQHKCIHGYMLLIGLYVERCKVWCYFVFWLFDCAVYLLSKCMPCKTFCLCVCAVEKRFPSALSVISHTSHTPSWSSIH